MSNKLLSKSSVEHFIDNRPSFDPFIEKVKIKHDEYASSDCLSNSFEEMTLLVGFSKDELDAFRNDPNHKNSLVFIPRILWGEQHDYIELLNKPTGLMGGFKGGNKAIVSDGTEFNIHDHYETKKVYLSHD